MPICKYFDLFSKYYGIEKLGYPSNINDQEGINIVENIKKVV